MKKREATRLHLIKKKAVVRDGDGIVPEGEKTKATAVKARDRAVIPNPAAPSRIPNPENLPIKTTRNATAENPETAAVPGDPIPA
jgi:hypothetical protein